LSQAQTGEDPYPALRAHLRLAKHPLTYSVKNADGTDRVICLECGEILDSLEADQARAAMRSAEKARLAKVAADAAVAAAEAQVALTKAKADAAAAAAEAAPSPSEAGVQPTESA
jgi:hypothetical protein